MGRRQLGYGVRRYDCHWQLGPWQFCEDTRHQQLHDNGQQPRIDGRIRCRPRRQALLQITF